MNLFSHAHIYRIYAQGVEAVVRLVHSLTDKVEDMEAQLDSKPQPATIASLAKELATTIASLARKNVQLIQARQLHHQLLCRIRELEAEVERSTPIERDSHNSSLPLSLDLPWKKVPRTRSLRQQSGLKPGGQFEHSGTTLVAAIDL